MNNISCVGDSCCGCGICEGICPVNAVTMVNKEGALRPVVNKDCVNCGKCVSSCTACLDKETVNYDAFQYQVWGHTNNVEARNESASGGIVSELFRYLLSNKIVDYVVTSDIYSLDSNMVSYRIIENAEDVAKYSGSNYCPVNMGAAVREIKKRGGRCAVVGVPCFIRGLVALKAADAVLNTSIKYVFALMCGHTPTYCGTTYLMKKFKVKKADTVKYRGDGWFGNIRFFVKDNETKRVSFTNYFTRDFYSHFWQKSCYECVDHFGIGADASFGDADFIKYRNPELINEGESIIFSNSTEFSNLLMEMKEKGIIDIFSDQTDAELKRVYGPISGKTEFGEECINSNAIAILFRLKLNQNKIYCFGKRVINKIKRVIGK